MCVSRVHVGRCGLPRPRTTGGHGVFCPRVSRNVVQGAESSVLAGGPETRTTGAPGAVDVSRGCPQSHNSVHDEIHDPYVRPCLVQTAEVPESTAPGTVARFGRLLLLRPTPSRVRDTNL